MSGEEVRVVRLEAMRVASVYGFGKEPENEAWSKLEGWAGPRGLMDDPQRRIFGFNNPNPSAGSPNYGYEFWITVDPETEAGGEARIKEFGGGLYAALCVEVKGDAYTAIPEAWKRLHRWCEQNGRRFGHHQWLEEHLSGQGDSFTLDLLMPIAE